MRGFSGIRAASGSMDRVMILMTSSLYKDEKGRGLLIPVAEIGLRIATAGGSFNGRTTDSDSVYPGSNPGLPANKCKGLAIYG